MGRSESCRARSGQVGCLEAPGGPAASDRARGGGRGQRARPRLCLRRRGPGVRRLCVTLAGVRAGAGKGTGSGGRGSLLRNRPRPLAHWLGAAALWRARREQLVRERRSAKGQPAAPGPRTSLRPSHLRRPHLPPGKPLAAPGQGQDLPPVLPLSTGTDSPSGGPGRLTCGQMHGWVPDSPQPAETYRERLLLPCFLASAFLGSGPLGRPPHFSGPQSFCL